MKKYGVYILPVNGKVIFPYQTVKIRLNENHQYSTKTFNNFIGLVTEFPEKKENQGADKEKKEKESKLNYNEEQLLTLNNMSQYGSLVKIYSTIQSYSFTSLSRSSGNGQEYRNISAVVISRFKVLKYTKQESYWVADIEIFSDEIPLTLEKQLFKDQNFLKLKALALEYYQIAFSPEVFQNRKAILESEQNIVKAVFQIAGNIEMKFEQKLIILQQEDINSRIGYLLKFVEDILNDKNIMQELNQKVSSQIKQETRQFYLKKQLGEINKELYGKDEDEFEELKKKIEKTDLPDEIRSAVQKEFAKLKKMSGQNADASVIRNYIDTVLDLPWRVSTVDQTDLKKAEQILDRDHAGLEKVKKRILEFLAVRKLKGNSKGSILCLHGPPGVGKTSLGKSVAEALNRKFQRIALGGVRDEAEIRGHRRTYVGALPGIFINTLKKCSSNNPVILLDEVDKLTRDQRGDPSSALLEVLDPSQNHTFTDHYLQLPFDLSNVLFIATCNSLDTIQPALLDRLEIINIPGYTKQEKFQIATKYLIPKQVNENGLLQEHIKFHAKAVNLVIDGYTREAGVRDLERNLGSICRNVAVQLIKFQETHSDDKVFTQVPISPEKVKEVLGQVPYDEDIRDRITVPGISIGMAWTASGGKILYVEASKSRGKGRVQITGQLGDVMKESVMTAIGWIKENISQLDIDKDSIMGVEQLLSRQKNQYIQNDKTGVEKMDMVEVSTELEFVSNIFDYLDIHVHFPAASTPKDGPSAGITIITALVSLLTSRKVRSDVSMTGEVSLKGLVLPVGGVKEKCLAAHTHGIKRIILPFKNKKDVDEIQKEIRDKIEFFFVKTVDEVLELALEKMKFVNEKSAGSLLLQKIRSEQQNKILKKSKL